jgi:hypothetical protein
MSNSNGVVDPALGRRRVHHGATVALINEGGLASVQQLILCHNAISDVQRGQELCWDESHDEMEDDKTDRRVSAKFNPAAVLVGRRGARRVSGAAVPRALDPERFGSQLLQRLKTLPPP